MAREHTPTGSRRPGSFFGCPYPYSRQHGRRLPAKAQLRSSSLSTTAARSASAFMQRPPATVSRPWSRSTRKGIAGGLQLRHYELLLKLGLELCVPIESRGHGQVRSLQRCWNVDCLL